MRNSLKINGAVLSLALIILGACAPAQSTPTLDPAAVYTHSVETVQARMTMTAAVVPDTPTPSNTPEPTFTLQTSGTSQGGTTQTAAQSPASTQTPSFIQTTAPTQATTQATTAATTAVQNRSTPAAGGGGVCNSAWVSEVGLQNGGTVAAGSQFTKTWRIKNTGTCTWTSSFQISYGWGERMNGQDVNLPHNVNPGEEIDLSVVLTAPSTAGQFGAFWRLRNNTQVFFGETFSVLIVVP